MWTEDDVWKALKDCYDPEIALNVVELGLVMSVALSVDDDAPGAGIAGVPVRQVLQVTMMATSENDGARALLRGMVENRLLGLEGLSRVMVTMVDEPRWTPARISAAGRKLLGMDGTAFPILNNRVR